MIILGDCRDRMAEMEENSVDAIVTDPPYELGFMGKSWDGSGIAYDQEVWRQAWRVLKPGGYILAFGGSRTYHRLACAIEDAGFVLHPMIAWVQGQGFPKATNLSKMINKAAGAEREVIGPNRFVKLNGKKNKTCYGKATRPNESSPATDAARQWDGWYYGRQSLKPSLEPICCAQKPPEGRMVDNVLRWGCGAVNVDGCRIGTDDIISQSGETVTTNCHPGYQRPNASMFNTGKSKERGGPANPSGRWPANLILGHAPGCVRRGEKKVKVDTCKIDQVGQGREGNHTKGIYGAKASKITTAYADSDGMETVADWDCVEGCPVKMIAEQSGITAAGARPKKRNNSQTTGGRCFGKYNDTEHDERVEYPGGSAARFFLQVDPDPLFYCAKASRAERTAGGTVECSHPTVKPLKLMRYLVRLVTPPGGVVLDPFAGSGTTLVAAKEEGFQYIGIELEPEYVEIAEARLAAAERPPATLEDFAP